MVMMRRPARWVVACLVAAMVVVNLAAQTVRAYDTETDCAEYLCSAELDTAASYISGGCMGSFSDYASRSTLESTVESTETRVSSASFVLLGTVSVLLSAIVGVVATAYGAPPPGENRRKFFPTL